MDLSFELAALGKSAVDAAHRSPDKAGGGGGKLGFRV